MPTVTLCAWAYGAAIKPIPSKPRIVRYRIFFGPPEICKTDFNFRIAILQNDGQTGLYVRKVITHVFSIYYARIALMSKAANFVPVVDSKRRWWFSTKCVTTLFICHATLLFAPRKIRMVGFQQGVTPRGKDIFDH